MNEKPILFSTEMVQAILEGRKTQTRRIIKHGFEKQPSHGTLCWWDKKLKASVACFWENEKHGPLLASFEENGGVIQTQTVRQSMALVTPMLVEMNRTGKTKRLLEATSTFTSGGVNHSMVSMPVVVENKGQSNSKSAMNACGTLTTEPHLGIVTDESWNSFIHYNYGKDTISHTKDPLGTATTRDRHSVISFQKPVLEDCYYRMLRASEIKLAMAFEKEYIVLGNQRDQVKQLGNAVTPPAMEWLIGQIVQSLM